MGAASFDCWCCVTTREGSEHGPIPGMCRECFDDVGEHAARDAYHEAVRNGDAPGGCAECGELDCICASLAHLRAKTDACCHFCGDAAAWMAGPASDFAVCQRPGCNARAQAEAHAAPL